MDGGPRNTIRLSATPRGVRAAAALLRQKGCVAFPTETVYGLGADARDDRAVAGIFAAKDRPLFNPLIIHAASADAALALCGEAKRAEVLAAAFWPGPLTLILPKRRGSGLSELVTAGADTLAVRVPAHPLATALLTSFGAPLAAPSANPSGRVSPTTADHVLDGLTGRIDAVLDGGPCEVGVESTILDLTGAHPRLARPGGVPLGALIDALGEPPAPMRPGPITAPGQLASHYAPTTHLTLAAQGADPTALWLAFGALNGRRGLTLSESGDLVEAAANLFAHLRALDAEAETAGETCILIDPIPEQGLGAAINDRLRRAAAPRTASHQNATP
ncbi:MAG: L-threonylcarbamoyladenylate synthase [Pseudomonadota bacterium]